MWNFINFHIRRMRENAATSVSNAASNSGEKKKKLQQKQAEQRKMKKAAEKENDDEMDLPEVDRDLGNKKTLRARK